MAESEYDYRGWPRSPRTVNKETWFYEEKKGLCIVRQIRDTKGRLVKADLFHLPWRFVLKAAKTPAAVRRRMAKRRKR
jgi:hypothetical protein